MTTRKNGQRKTDLSGESTDEVQKKAKSLCRTDWGGKDADTVIKKKLADAGVNAGPKAIEAVKKIAEEQVEGCRKRMFPRMDEVIKRVTGKTVVETLP